MTRPASAPRAVSVLAINGGSSTLKFPLFQASNHLARGLSGSFNRIVQRYGFHGLSYAFLMNPPMSPITRLFPPKTVE